MAAAAAAAVACALSLPAGAATPAGSDPPILILSASTAAVGSTLEVTADHLTPLADWQVAICGDGGLGTSADCSLDTAVTTSSSASGFFVAPLDVTVPPSPCPCVVLASPVALSGTPPTAEVSAPVTIPGAPVAAVHPDRPLDAYSGLHVLRAEITGDGSWSEWFAGPARRTLVVVMENEGVDVIPSTPFVVAAGRLGTTPTPQPTPTLPAIQPGERLTERVPLALPGPTVGAYRVTAALGTTGQTVTVSRQTVLVPWGWVAVAALLASWAVLAVVAAVRRRRARARVEPGVAAGGGPGGSGDGADAGTTGGGELQRVETSDDAPEPVPLGGQTGA